jgi:hypothetical protein
MAPFVNSGFVEGEARQFLKEMTGVDLGADPKRWLDWYELHKNE